MLQMRTGISSIYVVGLWTMCSVGCASEEHPAPDQQTTVVDDGRVAIAVNPEEHAALRSVMQANLVSMQRVFSACSNGDATTAAALARTAAETPGVGRSAPTLRPDLPDQWRSFSRPIHAAYESFADGVEASELTCADLSTTMAVITNGCVGCHATFHVVPASVP